MVLCVLLSATEAPYCQSQSLEKKQQQRMLLLDAEQTRP